MRKALVLTVILAAIAAAISLHRPAPQEGPVSASEDPEISLFAVGDVMPGRGVARAMLEHEPDWLFSHVAADIRQADIAFANLEAPIIAGEPVPDGSTRLRADPGVEGILARAGFDVLSVANNHAMDEGSQGLSKTLERLRSAGLRPVGGGSDAAAARAAEIVVVRGIRVAFLAYVDPTFTRGGDRAGDGSPGVAFMDPATVGDDIRAAEADVVIVSMHAGDEYADAPSPVQRAFARAAIDAGAEAVIGHHPHVIQPVESYKGKPILYSLGNFVFDQGWSEEAGLGMAADLRFGREGFRRIVRHPITVAAGGQPAFASGTFSDRALERLGDGARMW